MNLSVYRGQPRGQGLTEYIIIVGLIAVASLTAVTIFGNGIRSLISDSVKALAGDHNVQNSVTKGQTQDFQRSQKDFAKH
jgi:Flp pilus assembly pilin Flp